MITNILFVGIGGALGAISRFGVNEIFENYFTSSAGTLVVNIIGCFFIGIFVVLSLPVKDSTYYFFVIGFL